MSLAKKLLVTLLGICLIGCFIVIQIFVFKNSEEIAQDDPLPIVENGLTETDKEIFANPDIANNLSPKDYEDMGYIVSESITNSISLETSGSDKFWATMYRQDPATNKIYHVIDRRKFVLKEIKNADADTFHIISSRDGAPVSYARDRWGIYCNDKLQPELGVDTFRVFSEFDGFYARGNRYVYANCQIVNGADPNTFELIDFYTDDKYAKDRNRVYINGVPIEGSDPYTFNYLNYKNYSYDKENTYKGTQIVGKSYYNFSVTSTGRIVPTVNHANKQKNIAIFETDSGVSVIDKILPSDYYGMNKLIVSGGKIYFLGKQRLQSFEPKANTLQNISLGNLEVYDSDGTPKLSDFYIDGDDIYFLYGEYCEYNCKYDLYKFNLNNKNLILIVKDLDSSKIAGVDKNLDQIFVNKVFGDAGCVFGEITGVRLSDGQIVGSEKIEKCTADGYETDPAFEAAVNKLKYPTEFIANTKKEAYAIYVRNGEIVEPDKNMENSPEFQSNTKEVIYLNY